MRLKSTSLLIAALLFGCTRSVVPVLSDARHNWDDYKVLVWDATQAMDSKRIADFFRVPKVSPPMDGEVSEAYQLDFSKVIICNSYESIKAAVLQLTREEIQSLRNQVRCFESPDELYSSQFKDEQLDDLREIPTPN